MKTTQIAAAIVTALLASSAFALNSSTASGTLTLTGNITQAPCAIDTGSTSLSYNFGNVRWDSIPVGGIANTTPLAFNFVNCTGTGSVNIAISGGTNTDGVSAGTSFSTSGGAAPKAAGAYFGISVNNVQMSYNTASTFTLSPGAGTTASLPVVVTLNASAGGITAVGSATNAFTTSFTFN